MTNLSKVDCDYKRTMLKELMTRKFGDNIQLAKTHINYEKTVATAKCIIDWGEDIENGFILEFNNDGTILTKRKNDFFTP